jgi:hypothetical protein
MFMPKGRERATDAIGNAIAWDREKRSKRKQRIALGPADEPAGPSPGLGVLSPHLPGRGTAITGPIINISAPTTSTTRNAPLRIHLLFIPATSVVLTLGRYVLVESERGVPRHPLRVTSCGW